MIRYLFASLLLLPLLASPTVAQINSAEADAFGFGPQVGHPVMHLPDGRRIAISTWNLPIGLSGVSAWVYEEKVGKSLWRIHGEPCAIWQSSGPNPLVPKDRELDWISHQRGGAAVFPIEVVACASRQLVKYLGVVPDWGGTDSNVGLNTALRGWTMVPTKDGKGFMMVPQE
ncbi:MAG: hypothetical protein FJX54_20545 [Alphaproteobacteria bacterium]|nr:hypothetical protein [Alphaproteobacteria bacterium]